MKHIFPDIQLGPYTEETIDLRISAFEVFKRLYRHFPNVFLLESLGEEGKYNRYSYVGFDPVFTVSANNGELFIDKRCFKVANAFDTLTEFFRTLPKTKSTEGFCGGLVGYISYEGTRYFEPVFEGFPSYDFPCFAFGFYQDGLIFDKKGNTCTYFHYGISRLHTIRSLLNSTQRVGKVSVKKQADEKRRERHKQMIEQAQEHIKKGDIFQAVLSLKTHYQLDGDYRRIYALLRQMSPSPYMIYMRSEDRHIISASPELLIRVKGDTIEHFGTLAGTVKRGKDEKEDLLFKKRLLADEKEIAEHLMLVDLARNDVGKICAFGCVTVDHLATIKSYRFVHHLFTEIRGRLKNGEDSFSALAACFPAGTLTGAPKVEAMKIIYQLEGEARGPYGGVGGYFSLSGESMMAILIRSLFIKGEHAYTQTGSGIVLDSTPEKEYQEVENKQKAIEEALKQANE